jgi:hypothetical protein
MAGVAAADRGQTQSGQQMAHGNSPDGDFGYRLAYGLIAAHTQCE